MANLYPEGYETETMTADEIAGEQPVGYLRGVAFDFETGDFVRDGSNRLLGCSGVDSWKNWCMKTILTERYNHIAYSFDIGMELDTILDSSDREEAESRLTREITESLLADPYGRTEYVESIEYDWNGTDSVTVDIILRGMDDVTIDITVELNKGEG